MEQPLGRQAEQCLAAGQDPNTQRLCFGLRPTVASIHIRAEAAPVASVAVVVAASAWWPCGFPLLPRRYPTGHIMVVYRLTQRL